MISNKIFVPSGTPCSQYLTLPHCDMSQPVPCTGEDAAGHDCWFVARGQSTAVPTFNVHAASCKRPLCLHMIGMNLEADVPNANDG